MATPPNGIAELKVDGTLYGGWKKVRAIRSIEQMAGAFTLDITERWPGQPKATPIRHGQACQLLLDGDAVITGWVDDVVPDIDKDRHDIHVAGRDKTEDLVDCSAIHKSGQWHNAKLDQIARDLVKDYGIKVVVETDVGAAFSSFSIQEGETVFECLERAARQKAVLVTSNALGDLVLTRAGSSRVEIGLVEGKNIEAARGQFSRKERYSRYIVKGMGRLGRDGDTLHNAPSAQIDDPVIARHRPLIVLAETHGSNASLKDRAEWERNVRRGRSARGSITVQGWRRPDNGELWMPNTKVPVTAPSLWLNNAEMLIVGCVYTLDERGTLTELVIANPDAFLLLEGVAAGKLFGKLRSKDQRDRREKVDDWSML